MRSRNWAELHSSFSFPSALVPFCQPFAVAHLLLLIYLAVTVLALASFQHHGIPLFQLQQSSFSVIHCSHSILLEIFFLALCTSRSGAALSAQVPPLPGHNLPTHTTCLWVHPSPSPAVTSSCKHLGWWAPLKTLKQMAATVWVPVKATLMQAAFWKATSFPFPSPFWLLCNISHPAENEPAWKKDFVSNQLHPSLQLSLRSLSTHAGTEQDEIVSSVAWGRRSHFFNWLKQVVWMHLELASLLPLLSHF